MLLSLTNPDTRAEILTCEYKKNMVDIQKTRYKKQQLVTHIESHVSAVSLLKRAENSAI